mgnify:CR=1 FL=1
MTVLLCAQLENVNYFKSRRLNIIRETTQTACAWVQCVVQCARMSNMHVSAYMRELGRKGGKATGDKKKRSPEHYAKMAAASALARRKKNAAV